MSVEFEGQDLSEAILRAAEALGVPRETVRFTVLSMGTKGFLGFGKKLAKISVNPDDPVLELSEDQSPTPKTRYEQPKAAAGGPKTQTSDRVKVHAPKNSDGAANAHETGQKTSKKSAKGGTNRGAAPSAEKAPAPPFDKSSPSATSAGHETSSAKAPGNSKGRSGPYQAVHFRNSANSPTRPERSEPSAPASKPELKALDWSHVPPPPTRAAEGEERLENYSDSASNLVVEIVKSILERMGLAAEIRVERLGSRLLLSLEGGDLNALLIGSRGATLEALQLLASKIADRRFQEVGLSINPFERIIIDVADYRYRRWTHLLESLTTTVEAVRATERPQNIGGLNSAERRLIQLALRPYKDVATQVGRGRDSLSIVSKTASRHRRYKSGR